MMWMPRGRTLGVRTTGPGMARETHDLRLRLIFTAQAHKRHHHAIGRPRGFAAGLEAMILYLREEVVMKNIPHGGARARADCGRG